MSANKWAVALACLWLAPFLSRVWGAADASAPPNQNYVVEQWTTENGLPVDEVTAILQTRDGYLWLGTPGGLVRFDGNRFTVFDEGNTPGLNNSRITTLFEDRARRLWVGTESAGVVLFQNGTAQSIELGNEPRDDRLAALCEDDSGAVWLYLANGRLWRYENGQARFVPVSNLQASDYHGLAVDRSGAIWGANDAGLWWTDPKEGRAGSDPVWHAGPPVTGINLLLPSARGGLWCLAGRVYRWSAERSSPAELAASRPDRISELAPWGLNRVTCACEDARGNLVVGTSGGGLFWFDSNLEPTCVSTEQGLSGSYILSVYSDREGNLWVGTDGGGLNRITKPLIDTLEASRGAVVRSVSADGADGLWIGFNGRPVSYLKNGTIKSYTQQFDRYVRTVFVDRQQRVWGGSDGLGLLRFENGQFLRAWGTNSFNGFVNVIHQDRAGSLWVGTRQGLVGWNGQEWKAQEALSNSWVQALADDAHGNFWVGTAGRGLLQWRNGAATVFRKGAGGLPSDTICCLLVDRDDALWVGTDGGGLGRLQGGTWTRFTRQNGLPSNTISSLTEDDQGYLWIGSNAGLIRATRQSLNDFAAGRTNYVNCRVYGRLDGMPTRECTMGAQPGACSTRDGKLWFATIKGLVSINPAQLKVKSTPPPVTIEAVLVDGAPQKLSSNPNPTVLLTIAPRKEQLEIQYSSLGLTAPERARFRYWLEGHENGWTEAGHTREVHYSKLPPGHYQFHVTACNEDGVWNETGASLAFVVLPPFWRTPWFLGSVTAVFLAGVTGLVHYLSTQKLQRQLVLLRQQEALERERSRIARDIHDQLGASLTQVALLGELVEGDKDSPVEVEGHARQISQTARDTTRVLDEIVWAVNPANDTLDGLMTYVCKYVQEYLAVAGIHYRLDVPHDLPATPLPPEVRHNVFLVCKEAVTNVVRHAKATEVQVRLQLHAKSFTLEIQDNGRGLAHFNEEAARLRNGLRNMRKRMESVGGSFVIEPVAESGARVRLTAPLGPEPAAISDRSI